MKKKIIAFLDYAINLLGSIQTIYNYTFSIALIISWVIVNYVNLGIGLGLISIGLWWLAIAEGTKQAKTLKRIENNIAELKKLFIQIPNNKGNRINKSKQSKEDIKQTTSKSSSEKSRKGTNKVINSKDKKPSRSKA